MPVIDIAMAHSLATKRSVLDVLASAMGPVLYGRDVSSVSDKITDVKTAFSSWDNCMNADFCKYVVFYGNTLGYLESFSSLTVLVLLLSLLGGLSSQ